LSATSRTTGLRALDARPCRAVVFDFDGTLARLNIDFVAMRSDVLKLTAQYGLAAETVCDLPALELIDRARATLAAVEPSRAEAYRAAAHTRIMEIELAAARAGELFGGTRELLVALRKRRIGTAIITRNCLRAVRTVFPDLDQFVDAAISREMTPRVKPHPDHLRTALAVLSAPPDGALHGGGPSLGHAGWTRGRRVHRRRPHRVRATERASPGPGRGAFWRRRGTFSTSSTEPGNPERPSPTRSAGVSAPAFLLTQTRRSCFIETRSHCAAPILCLGESRTCQRIRG